MRTTPISQALLGILLCTAAPHLLAQDTSGTAASRDQNDQAAPERARNLDTVVVTGRSGVETRTKAEASYSITTIDEDRLRMQAPTSVTDALKSVPGFWVESSGGVASGNIRARGIPVDGFGSVNLLEDGLPVQHDPALGYLNADQAFRLDETIDRIEVVRGGPSSVFYSNAPAGAINFIPRQVGDMAEGIAKFEVGDYGLTRGDFWYGTPLSNGWKLSAGGFYRTDSGIRQPGFNADDGGQIRLSLSKDFDKGRFSVDYKHMDDKAMLFLGIPMTRYSGGKLRAVPGFDGNYGTLAGPDTEHVLMKRADGSTYDFDNTQGTHVKRDQLTVKFDYEFAGGWKFSDGMRFSKTDTQRNGLFPNSVSGAGTFLSNFMKQNAKWLPAGTAGLQLRYVDNPSQVFDNQGQNGNGLVVNAGLRGVTMPLSEFINDARLMQKFDFGGQTHDVTLGYYFAHFNQGFSRYSSSALIDVQDNARLLNLVAVNAAGQPIQNITANGIYNYGYEWADSRGGSTTNAVYLSDEWQATDQLRIDGGLRWENVHLGGSTQLPTKVNQGAFTTSQMLTGSGTYVPYDVSYDKLGWTLGANWQFDQRQGLFARWTSTFRLPNLGTYIGASSAPINPPIVQTMDLGEVGYKYSSRQLEFYATGFYTKYDNVGFSNYVYNAITGASTNQQGYAGTRTYGLELDSTWYPVDWFDVQATATLENPKYQNLRYTQLVAGQPVLIDYVGNQLIRVPKVSYRIVPGLNLFDHRLRLQLAYEYEGKRYVDTANSVVLPSYKMLSASARWQVSPMTSLFFYADNITNSQGLTEGNPRAGELNSADVGASTFIARPILGRTYRAAIMYRF